MLLTLVRLHCHVFIACHKMQPEIVSSDWLGSKTPKAPALCML